MNPLSGINSELTAQTVAAEGRAVTATQGLVEDTALLNISHGPTAYFEIIPATIVTQEAGMNFSLTIRARDSFGNLATRYNKVVNLDDSTGTLTPDTVSFTDGEWSGMVRITQATSGIVITASDGVTTGNSNAFTVLPSALHHFGLEDYPGGTVAGATFVDPVVVTAYDAYDNIKTNYTGQVYFTSDDPQAVLPFTSSSRYTFVSGDQGSHSFPGNGFQLRRTVTRHITVTDGTVSEGSDDITVWPAGLDHFGLGGYPTEVTAGTSWDNYGATVVVTAFDAYENVKTNYVGSVQFESTDGQAVLPAPYPFTSGDQGVHEFAGSEFELRRTPIRRITVRDGAVEEESANIVVWPAALDSFTIDAIGDQVAGVSFQARIYAWDRWNNLQTEYNGLPILADTTGTILPTVTASGCFLGDGSCFQSVVITRAWATVHITVTDVGEGISEESNAFDVSPAPLHHIRINSAPDNGGQGYAYPVEVGQHVMDIYQTYSVWAAGYDQFDNYRDDLGADWGLTGVLASGEIAPTPAISATFSPAPILSGTGVITAAYAGLADSTDLFTIQAPWLVVSKAGPQVMVPAGTENMQYTIVYTNVGNAPAYDVEITDTYDSNTSYAWANPAHYASDNYVVWSDAVVAEGERVQGTFLLVDVAGSLVPNTVLSNLVEIGGPRIETHSFIETTVVTATPDLSVSLSDSRDPVGAGEDFVLEVTLRNDGTAPVDNIVFTLTLDSHLTYRGATLTPVTPPTPASENVGRWELASLAGNDDYEFEVSLRVDNLMENGYVLFHRAQVQSDQTAPAYGTELTEVTAPILALSQVSAPRPAVAYSPLTFTLSYSNVGQADSQAVILNDVIPDNTDFVSCFPAPCSESGGVVTWLINDGIEAMSGDQAGMVVNVHRNLDSGTVLTNQAHIYVSAASGYSATAELTTTVASTPNLGLNISVERDLVDVGEEVLFTFNYSNTGSGRAYDVSIVAVQPSSQYVDYLGCSGTLDCSSGGGQITYDLGTVEGGASDIVTMSVRVHDPLPAGARVITTTGVISSVTPGDALADNFSQKVVTFTTLPDLQLYVDYMHHTPYPGQILTYTLNYSNAGHIAATGVVITFAQPHYTTFIASASDDWQDQGNGQYIYPVGELGYEEQGTLLFVITMPTVTFTSTMSNFNAAVGIYDDGGSGKDGNLADNWLLLPQEVPDVIVEDVEVNWVTLLGGQLGRHVTVTVRNLGAAPACNSVPGSKDSLTEPHCSPFWIDLYINPGTPPHSYPTDYIYGQVSTNTVKVGASLTTVVVFDPFAITAGISATLYVRLDNNSPERFFGDVPEYNEYNNVSGPIHGYAPYSIYLPCAARNYPKENSQSRTTLSP
jgi:uncharacterized repeat protein (TIGR01451 family)